MTGPGGAAPPGGFRRPKRVRPLGRPQEGQTPLEFELIRREAEELISPKSKEEPDKK
jgi:hypothetical protein